MVEVQMKLKVTRVSTVAPAIPTAKHSMFLSAIDISNIPNNNMENPFLYKTPDHTANKDFPTIVKKLKKSMLLVMVEFYPFASRLDMKGGEWGRPQIDYNDDGVEFIEETIEMPFEDVEADDFQHQNFFQELVQTRHGNEEDSLLSIEVIAFQGGGFCIGANFHHVIAYENSFMHFMNSWAECSREVSISKSPHHMRTFFQRENKNEAIPNLFLRAEEVVTDLIKEAQIFRFVPDNTPPLKYSKINASVGDPSVENIDISIVQNFVEDETNLEISTLHSSEKIIQALKERSGASTSFVALSAQFWRCIMKSQQVPEKESVYFRVPIDFRGQVKPPLPPTYFGNCICRGISETTAKQLLEEDIVFAAILIQELIFSCGIAVHINNFVDFIESHLGCRNINPILGNLCNDYIVMTFMSLKFRVSEIDHGWGRPLSVQAASLKEIGRMKLFLGREGGKCIDVSTKLPHD
eukprot:PITA_25509